MGAGAETEDAFKTRFARQLKATRIEMGLSQPEMAGKLECSVSMYPKYENRDHFPLWLLPRLIEVTDKPLSYWIYGVPHTPTSEKPTPHRLKVVK
jgi:transcriptional regulator with XRE-family HTH domain